LISAQTNIEGLNEAMGSALVSRPAREHCAVPRRHLAAHLHCLRGGLGVAFFTWHALGSLSAAAKFQGSTAVSSTQVEGESAHHLPGPHM